ncbi:hypothetical protein B0A55_07090 [Friedmanniomyces simplex]|uniref:Uncharacterized protein n=1 Tax=Friedmanniomyces simplex TaxID=329884 RepID=A0A4U0XEX5_9PEZI|nr:hypothetical protein B0A55_07090 [Friedmanniomyces simplex]
MSDKEGRHEPARSAIPVPSQDLVPISGTIQAPNDRWRAQDIVFAFGPKDTYFISTSPDQWRFRLDSNNAREVKSLGIARPASFALIAYGSYIAVYSRDDGGMNIAKGGSRQRMISSTEATEWVEAHAAFDGVFKFLGQDGDGDVRRQASFCVGPEGTCLNGYKDLAKYLDEIGDRPNTVVLSPYDNRDWFLVQTAGREYMQRVAKARGQTFVTTSDGTQHVITPDTNYIYDKVPEPRANQWVLELARIEKSLHAGLEDARRRMEALHSRFEAPSLLQDKKHPAIVVTGTATPVLLGWLLYRQLRGY